MADLIELKKQLAKALNQKDCNTVMDLLEELRNKQPSSAQIASSKIGVFVQKLVSYDDPDVSSSAKLTLSKWKLIEANNTSIPSEPSSSMDKPKPIKKSAPTVREEKDTVRSKIQTRLGSQIASRAKTAPKEEIDELAYEIETALYNRFPKGSQKEEYKAKFLELSASIRHSKNQWLVDDLVNGNIPPKQFVEMTEEELQSPEERERRLAIHKQMMQDTMAAQPQGTKTDMFFCGKCKKSEVVIERQLQTRSADEPMTLYLRCGHCGARWKQ